MVSLSQLIDQKGKFFQCFKYSGKTIALLMDFCLPRLPHSRPARSRTKVPEGKY
jgi:hypothetical protein